MRLTPLPRSFYEPSAQIVAAKLIGHFLIRATAQGVCGGPIVETEAYLEGDPACHAACGRTPRNRVMFGPPGHAYVYFIYGAHYCVNAVCLPAERAEAVLIRAIEPTIGIDVLQSERPAVTKRELTNGPAKLCEAMSIDRALDGADLCDPKSPLFIARSEEIKTFLARHGPLVTTPRIGITRAAERPLRFLLDGNQFVSQRKHKTRLKTACQTKNSCS
jgi:DNA-3-methyladenine glycosylase